MASSLQRFDDSARPTLFLDALPTDILVAILRLLPVVPRIRTIARLNKRWCELAYRSVDSLARKTIDWARQVNTLARLSSLTSLEIATPSGPVRLPSALTHLGLLVNPQHSLQLLEPIPSQLTSFALLAADFSVGVEPLLARIGSSLRRFRLQFNSSRLQSLGTFLASAHFPSLTALSIGFPFSVNHDVLAFYSRHSSQLLELTLTYVPLELGREIAAQALPNLHTLDWQSSLFGSDAVLPLLASCPQLTSVHLRTLPKPIPTLVTALHSLALFGFEIPKSRPFSRLSSLSVLNLDDEDLQAFGEHGTVLTACTISTTPTGVSLQLLPRLKNLTLGLFHSPDVLLPIPPLTGLTTLELIRGPLTDQMELALHFVRACPSLRTIKLHSPDGPGLLTEGFLRELDQHGLQVLTSPVACQTQVALHWLVLRVGEFDWESED